MTLTNEEKLTLKNLAKRLNELANLPCQKEKKALWEKHNTLQGERPMFLCDQLPWNEMDPLCVSGTIEDVYFRGVEIWLRQEIFKAEKLLTDAVVDPYIKINLPYENSGRGLKSQVKTMRLDPSGQVNSQLISCLINEPEDIEKITLPVITPREDLVKQITEIADEVFDGIMPWRFVGAVMHLGAWDQISYFMGVENIYIELMDRPEMMHALMEKMTQTYFAEIEQLNKYHLYDTCGSYCHCSHTYMPGDDLNREAVSQNGWAFGLAQPFTSVSPQITEEFECAYMKRIFPYFKNIYYGCCDRLDDRLDKVGALPNVRKISCSPWSHRESFAEKLPASIIMSNKPSPAFLATDSFDENAVRKDLRRTIDAARANGKTLEMILKDVSTIRYDLSRLQRFCEIAREEAER